MTEHSKFHIQAGQIRWISGNQFILNATQLEPAVGIA